MRPIWLVALLLVACDDGASGEATPDVAVDVGAPDARPDGAPPDGRVPDAAPDMGPDAAAPDMGQDAEAQVDAGLPPAVRALLDQGWLRVSQGLAHEGLIAFEAALAEAPGLPEAHYGAAVAGGADALELLSMIASLPAQLGNFKTTRNEYLAEALHTELVRLRAEVLRALDHALAVSPEDVDVDVDAVWVYLGLKPILVLRGHLDGGDLHLLRAALAGVAAVLDVLAAQSLDSDLLSAVGAASGDMPLDFPHLSPLLGRLLSEEAFLALHPEDGAQIFAEGGVHLSLVGSELAAAVAWMSEAPADARPQVSAVVQTARGAVLTLSSLALADPEGIGPPVEVPLTLTFSPARLAAFTHASQSFTEPGALVPFDTEVVPILGTLAYVALKLGLLDSLAERSPVDVQLLTQDTLEALLRTLLPLPVALDFGTFFTQPAGLRALLPRATEAGFVVEWECPEETAADGFPGGALRLLCAGEALVDAPHFGETAPADGEARALPYLDFDDPTLNGLLWVRDETGGFVRPDVFSLNQVLGALTPLLGLLGN